MIDDSRLPVVLEFNVFKYQKSRKCGSMGLQYARRYVVKTAFETEAAKRDIEKNRKKILSRVKHYTIPALVYSEVDKCKLAEDLLENNKTNQSEITAKVVEQKDADTETFVSTEIPEFKFEDILGQEVITIYKKPFVPKVETEEIIVAPQQKQIEQVTPKQESAEKTVVPLQSNDILSNDTIIYYKKTPNFENNTNKKSEIQEQKTQNQNVIKAVVPKTEQPIINVEQKKNKKVKKNKNVTYNVTNSKDDFYAKPLTKKEIKARKKQLKKEHSEKAKKERAKRAAKNLNEN
jgi:hypothetical protein